MKASMPCSSPTTSMFCRSECGMNNLSFLSVSKNIFEIFFGVRKSKPENERVAEDSQSIFHWADQLLFDQSRALLPFNCDMSAWIKCFSKKDKVLYLQGLERGIEANWNSRNRSHVQLRRMVSVLCNEVWWTTVHTAYRRESTHFSSVEFWEIFANAIT